MAIHSTAFGVTKLTKQDSEKFRRQVAYGRPPEAARESLKHGEQLLKSFQKNGSVKLKLKSSR